jgi:glucose-6-phosphate 1-epimerase
MAGMGGECYANMACVETANAADDVVAIAPGAEHTLGVRYYLECGSTATV